MSCPAQVSLRYLLNIFILKTAATAVSAERMFSAAGWQVSSRRHRPGASTTANLSTLSAWSKEGWVPEVEALCNRRRKWIRSGPVYNKCSEQLRTFFICSVLCLCSSFCSCSVLFVFLWFCSVLHQMFQTCSEHCRANNVPAILRPRSTLSEHNTDWLAEGGLCACFHHQRANVDDLQNFKFK